ncbi:MAG TPA: SxtJ family membrane protein [Ignavibacteriaceae bacterium]|nr:SxtJ family membrane protein [Ignavibacteriaceae bacterium]
MIIEEIKNIKGSKRDLRKFGLTVGLVLIAIAAFLFWKQKGSYPIFTIIALFLIVSGLLFPLILRPLNKVWMTLAILMGWVMTRVILIILFFIVLTPLSFVARIFRKKFLDLDIDKTKESYWEIREKKEINPVEYERQF